MPNERRGSPCHIFKDIEDAIISKEKEKGLSTTQSRKSFNHLYTFKGGPFKADEFHRLCDGKGPTLTLLNGKYNTIFGGYTSKDWSCEKFRIKSDEDAFLFFKNENAEANCIFLKIPDENKDNAIVCHKTFGPTFGYTPLMLGRAKYDLQTLVDKKSNLEQHNGYFQLNGQLNIPTIYKQNDANEIQRGDVNSGSMLVSSVEVYQVIDDKLKKPWRETLTDSKVEETIQELENIQPISGLGLDHYNILLLGAIGSGKSSFYNTVATVFAQKVKNIAPTAEAESSVTNQVHAYKILNEKGEASKIRIYDIRGFEEARNYGDELELLLEGKITDGYIFKDKPQSKSEINTTEKPTINDEIHLVCFVVDSASIKVYSNELLEEIAAIKTLINRKGLPFVCVATKFDHLCPRIKEDAGHIYFSTKAKDMVQYISTTLGFEERHIFPVVNYINDTKCDEKKRLAIQALSSMVELIKGVLLQKRGQQPQNSWSDRVRQLGISTSAEDKKSDIDKKMSALGDKTMRVLCYGPVNSGKSNFIDSVMSTLTSKIVSGATGGHLVENTGQTSKTKQFQTYRLMPNRNVFICDMPGIQEEEGMTLEQTKIVMKGHATDLYKILNGFEKDSENDITDSWPVNIFHCVCFVFDVFSLKDIPESILKTCREFEEWLLDEKIPFVVVLTKGDKVSTSVRGDTLEMFNNNLIRENKDKLIQFFGFRESRLFPVCNYIHESCNVPEIDALLLEALREILSLGTEYLERCQQMPASGERKDRDCDIEQNIDT